MAAREAAERILATASTPLSGSVTAGPSVVSRLESQLTPDIQLVSVDGGGWAIREADIYLNGDEASWHGIDPDGVDLRAVLIHALGHALGLMHPCELGGTAEAPACGSTARDIARPYSSQFMPKTVGPFCRLFARPLLYSVRRDGLRRVCRRPRLHRRSLPKPRDVLACGRDGVDACSACAADADCASGRYCEDGACAERLGVGARCSADRECEHGNVPRGRVHHSLREPLRLPG